MNPASNDMCLPLTPARVNMCKTTGCMASFNGTFHWFQLEKQNEADGRMPHPGATSTPVNFQAAAAGSPLRSSQPVSPRLSPPSTIMDAGTPISGKSGNIGRSSSFETLPPLQHAKVMTLNRFYFEFRFKVTVDLTLSLFLPLAEPEFAATFTRPRIWYVA